MTIMDINPIPKNHFVAITTGVHSDYDLHGVYQTLKTLDTEAELKAYVTVFPDRARDIKPALFLAWLHGRDLLEKIDCFELHLGGYDGDPDDVNVKEIEG